MILEKKVRAVEQLFGRLEKEMVKFKSETGLHCLTDCGFCCTRPNVMASPTEFLPLAWHLYKSGQADQFLDELETNPISLCPLFRTLKSEENKGFCGGYAYRGLVCRLFGFAAMINKHGQPELSTCKLIKEDQKEAFLSASTRLKEGLNVPVFKNYYSQLSNIDPDQGREMLPIKEAIKKAVEQVLWDRFYRDGGGTAVG